jgi:LytS/YehU family sensor histidine kinase
MGTPFGGWKGKMLENAAFITPWVLIGLCLLIAENRGNMQAEKTRNELRYLRHQVNPHFLLNTHNNIHFLIESNPGLAADMLLRLSGIMQYMLYECAADKVPLSKELQNLVNYIDLEKIRKDPALDVEHNLHEVTGTAAIAPLLLISFVENAFKHVSNHKDRENFIRIVADVQTDAFSFTVTNSKGTFRPQEASGIGLQNVKQRLRLLYPKKHTLTIENGKDVFFAQLRLQLK